MVSDFASIALPGRRFWKSLTSVTISTSKFDRANSNNTNRRSASSWPIIAALRSCGRLASSITPFSVWWRQTLTRNLRCSRNWALNSGTPVAPCTRQTRRPSIDRHRYSSAVWPANDWPVAVWTVSSDAVFEAMFFINIVFFLYMCFCSIGIGEGEERQRQQASYDVPSARSYSRPRITTSVAQPDQEG